MILCSFRLRQRREQRQGGDGRGGGGPSFDAEEENNISVYRKVLPSVVNITSRTVEFDFFYGEVPQQGQGSGFVIDKQGHILTNYHVVQGAQQVEVTF